MTEREAQILNWIKDNPLISQDELAVKANITRSSVAVHISNLMKKGVIKGKGYIMETQKGIAVVGAVNIDIGGEPLEKMHEKDSIPGIISYTPGGVGRNIAHNLSLLSNDVKLITLFGDDMWSAEITNSCKKLGIDISDARQISARTSTYMFIKNESGEMITAVSDMEIYENMTPEFLEQRMTAINNQALCVCDTNIPRSSLEYLFNNVKCPIFVDPVSTAKAVKLKGLLDKVHTIKPNLAEAELLSGVKITNYKTLELAAENLLKAGVTQVFISMGAKGLYAANSSVKMTIPCYDVQIKNTTGAGDALAAGIAHAYLKGLNIEGQALYGLAASAICVQSNDSVSEQISEENIEKISGINI